jgi:hypothetical protein
MEKEDRGDERMKINEISVDGVAAIIEVYFDEHKAMEYNPEDLAKVILYNLTETEKLEKKTFICAPRSHHFRVLKRGYYKAEGESTATFAPMNQKVAYSTLFCVKCGHVIEVVSADYRKGE